MRDSRRGLHLTSKVAQDGEEQPAEVKDRRVSVMSMARLNTAVPDSDGVLISVFARLACLPLRCLCLTSEVT